LIILFISQRMMLFFNLLVYFQNELVPGFQNK